MAILVGHKGTSGARGTVAPDLQRAEAAAEQATAIALPEGVLSVAAYRAWFDDYSRAMVRPENRPACAVENVVLKVQPAEVALRLFNPHKPESVIVFAHGGGWMMGNVETHDHVCRWLALATNSRVISIDYALAPEQPFPFAVVQVANVLDAVLNERSLNAGLAVIAAGDSAGANIASLALLRLPSGRRKQIAGFVSIYGAYAPGMDLSSHLLFANGPFGPSRQLMLWCWNLYAPHLSGEDRQAASPLGMAIADFPPTLCIAAECDLLIDDTLAFYGALAKAGTDVSLSLWTGMTHGALHFVGKVDSVTTAAQSIVDFVAARRIHSSPSSASLGRLLAEAEPRERVQLPFLSDETYLAPENAIAIRTPHLMARARRYGSLAHSLGTDIIKGIYPPGAALIPEEGSEAAGRSSYREAVRTLAAKGLVVATPKIGTRVAPRSSWRLLDPDVLAWHFESRLDEPFVRDAFEWRKVAEPSAAALAALRLAPDARAAMAGALAEMTAHGAGTPRWHAGRLSFHESVVTGGKNQLLGATWPSIRVVLEWVGGLRRPGDQVGDGDEAVAYSTVFSRIASGDAEGAMIAMAHIVDLNLMEAIAVLTRTRAASARSVSEVENS